MVGLRVTALTFALARSLGAAGALAQPASATLDRGDGRSQLGIDTAWIVPKDGAGVLRLEAYGYKVESNGLGIFGAIPIARSFGDAGTLALGSADLGILYVVEPTERITLVSRLGAALPLASNEPDAIATNAIASVARLTDLVLVTPNAYYFRVGVSPIVRHGSLIFRADLGGDFGLEGNGTSATTRVRLDASAGIALGRITTSLEFAASVAIPAPDAGSRVAETLSISARLAGHRAQPLLAIGVPLDAGTRAIASFFVCGGMQYTFAAPR